MGDWAAVSFDLRRSVSNLVLFVLESMPLAWPFSPPTNAGSCVGPLPPPPLLPPPLLQQQPFLQQQPHLPLHQQPQQQPQQQPLLQKEQQESKTCASDDVNDFLDHWLQLQPTLPPPPPPHLSYPEPVGSGGRPPRDVQTRKTAASGGGAKKRARSAGSSGSGRSLSHPHDEAVGSSCSTTTTTLTYTPAAAGRAHKTPSLETMV